MDVILIMSSSSQTEHRYPQQTSGAGLQKWCTSYTRQDTCTSRSIGQDTGRPAACRNTVEQIPGRSVSKRGTHSSPSLPSGFKCVLGCRFCCCLLAILPTGSAEVRIFIALATNIREIVFSGIVIRCAVRRERLVHTGTPVVWLCRCASRLWHALQSFVPVSRSR